MLRHFLGRRADALRHPLRPLSAASLATRHEAWGPRLGASAISHRVFTYLTSNLQPPISISPASSGRRNGGQGRVRRPTLGPVQGPRSESPPGPPERDVAASCSVAATSIKEGWASLRTLLHSQSNPNLLRWSVAIYRTRIAQRVVGRGGFEPP